MTALRAEPVLYQLTGASELWAEQPARTPARTPASPPIKPIQTNQSNAARHQEACSVKVRKNVSIQQTECMDIYIQPNWQSTCDETDDI